MSVRDKLMFDTSAFPSSSDITIGTEQFTISLNYRHLTDTFYLDLYDDSGEPLILGEKLVYGMPLWNINDARLPSTTLIVLDETGVESTVSYLNFQQDVFVYYDDLPASVTNPTNDNTDDTDVSDDLLDTDDETTTTDDDASYDANPYALPTNGGDM